MCQDQSNMASFSPTNTCTWVSAKKMAPSSCCSIKWKKMALYYAKICFGWGKNKWGQMRLVFWPPCHTLGPFFCTCPQNLCFRLRWSRDSRCPAHNSFWWVAAWRTLKSLWGLEYGPTVCGAALQICGLHWRHSVPQIPYTLYTLQKKKKKKKSCLAQKPFWWAATWRTLEFLGALGLGTHCCACVVLLFKLAVGAELLYVGEVSGYKIFSY